MLALSPEPLTSVPVYAELGLDGATSQHRLREDVVRRLTSAHRSLPDGFGVAVLDGWRSAAFQQVLYDHYSARDSDLPEGFVSDPSDDRVVAPHTTGGAVDLTLTWNGVPLGLGTDFDAFEPEASVTYFEAPERDGTIRMLRRLLGSVLTASGFAPYPLEWWHWSYGDQWWAAHAGHGEALYGLARG